MARQSGLGKGLSSLIPPEDREVQGAASVLRNVAPSEITPNPRQPRRHFDAEALEGLAASVASLGVLQPILVRELENGRYELVAGERRWRAAQIAKLDRMPVLVRNVTNEGSLEEALVENLHRKDLNALEEAAALAQLIDEFGMSHDELAKRLGKSRPSISNLLRLLQLPPNAQKLLVEGRLSSTQARTLLGAPDDVAFQEELALLAVDGAMTVRQLEDAVRTHVYGDEFDADGSTDESSAGVVHDGAKKRPRKRPRAKTTLEPQDPAVLELQEHLAERFATSVKVQLGPTKRGRVVVDFATLEDLERVFRVMMGGATEPGAPAYITDEPSVPPERPSGVIDLTS